MPSAELRGRIRWADADALGRLHFPRMFEYFEDAEAALLNSLGYSLQQWGREYDFPRIHVECEYKRVLALNAPFLIHITVGKVGRSSIRWEYNVFADEEKTQLAIIGSMTIVAVRDGKPVSLPPDLRQALGGDATTQT